MDWTYKAVLTAMTVAVVLMAARLIGRRVAGMLAGLPVITVPALLWLAQEQGIDFAVRSAVGSAAACAMVPLFAAIFVGLARRHGPAFSLGGAALLAWAALTVLHGLEGQPALALAVAAASCVLVLRGMSAPKPAQSEGDFGASGTTVQSDPGDVRALAGAVDDLAAARWRRPRPARPLASEPWVTAVVAGVVSAVVGLLASEVGPYWAGVLSTLPLISACALVHLHRMGDHGALRGFVAGYVLGVLAKAVFVCVFAWVAPLLGAVSGMAVAAAVGALGALAVSRWQAAGVARPASGALRAVRVWRP